MTIDLTDTTTGAIDQALTEARRRLGGMTLGMVLTLIIVTDEAAQYDAIRAANQAATEHPCRILAVITRKPKVLFEGAYVAAPIWKTVASALITQWQIAP